MNLLKNYVFSCLLVVSSSLIRGSQHDVYDLAVVGTLCFADGIGRQSIGVIDILSPYIKIKYIPSRLFVPVYKQDLPESVRTIVEKKSVGKARVALLEDLLTCGPYSAYKRVPNAQVKLAYTMVESTRLCSAWVNILNTHFDAALVPDPYLAEVYKSSGVTIPVFVVPLGMYIDDLLEAPAQKKTDGPFVFGFSGSFVERKNHRCVLEAFLKAYRNNPKFKLILHGRNGHDTYDELVDMVHEAGATNVEVIRSCWSWDEYVKFLKSLDCYVSVSKGEGFSLTPREAMALGIPCIISDNTAQSSICKSGFVYALAPSGSKPAYYAHLDDVLGDYFETDSDQLAKSLKSMYRNYPRWWEKAQQGRVWMRQFSYKTLTPTYLSLIKPQSVHLVDATAGGEDIITADGIVTTSPTLYKKYKTLVEV